MIDIVIIFYDHTKTVTNNRYYTTEATTYKYSSRLIIPFIHKNNNLLGTDPKAERKTRKRRGHRCDGTGTINKRRWSRLTLSANSIFLISP